MPAAVLVRASADVETTTTLLSPRDTLPVTAEVTTELAVLANTVEELPRRSVRPLNNPSVALVLEPPLFDVEFPVALLITLGK